MPRKIQRCLLLTLMTLFSHCSCADWFSGPQNYEECILENMTGVEANTAAQSIKRACRKKFPLKRASAEQILSNNALKLITFKYQPVGGDCDIENGEIKTCRSINLRFKVYNGNAEFTISRIIFEVIFATENKTDAYQKAIEIQPLSLKEFNLNFLLYGGPFEKVTLKQVRGYGS